MSRPAFSLVALFGALSLLSAFLLFQVQPVISKFILPWFGGSPGVWTTCMVFFQMVLFGGYAYAHFLTRLSRRRQWLVHGLLVVAALAFLPITPDESWKPGGQEDPAGRILLLLSATVGLPYFVLSSTSPLAQVWFTRASRGSLPWRLYALSNAGSLAALLTYPFFFEVRWDVRGQTLLWSAAFVLFAALSIFILWRDHRAARGAPAEASVPGWIQDNGDVSWWRRALWLLLPALASVLLLAGTNHVCQDVAVIPFLWVVPLSLYLITFIICFEHERWYRPLPWAVLALGLVFLAAVYPGLACMQDISYKMELLICFSAVFSGCMVCHGELTRLKPQPRHLTEFYLMMSAGGAAGGLLVSLVAPRVFDSYREWPLGLAAVFGVASLVLIRQTLRVGSARTGRVLAGMAGAAVIAGGCYFNKWRVADEPRIERVRNFYGVVSVDEEPYGTDYEFTFRSLYHGGIMHGMQIIGDASLDDPGSYYGRHTGVGRALGSLAGRADARVGVVGMGTATALWYGEKGQTWRIYEINPEVVRLAKTRFTYIDDFEKKGGRLEVVVADGRLALEHEQSRQFDVLLLDAFSGDSVPMHLLTREAFLIYQRHLKPGGIIVVNCTNTYISLASVIRKIALDLGYGFTRIGTDWEDPHEITDYMLLTRDQAFLAANPPESTYDASYLDVSLWTDRRHNLFEILERE